MKCDGIWWDLLEMIRLLCWTIVSENMAPIRQMLFWNGETQRVFSLCCYEEHFLQPTMWSSWLLEALGSSSHNQLWLPFSGHFDFNICINWGFIKNLLFCQKFAKAASKRPFFVFLLYVSGWVYVCTHGLSDVLNGLVMCLNCFLNLISRWKDKKTWQQHTIEYF